MNEIGEILGSFLWRSSLLIAAAYLLNAVLFRKCPAHRYTVLLVVLMLLPFVWLSAGWSFESPFLHPGIETARPDAAMPVLLELSKMSRHCNAPGDWINGQVSAGIVDRSDGFDPSPWMLSVWLAGTCVFMARLIRHQIRLRRLVSQARPLTEGALYRRFARIMGSLHASRRMRLLETELLTGPAAAGVFLPVVFVPSETANLADPGLDETLAHEILHHKRRDLLFHHLAGLVQGLFWFHPLVYPIIRSLGVERERAVDLAVVELLGDSDGYIDKLHDTARRVAGSRMPTARAAALLGARASVIRRRIKMLLYHSRFHTARRPLLFAASLVIVFGAAALFLAIGSCAGAKAVGASEEAKPFRTWIVGTDARGDYRLYNGLESVEKVALIPKDKENTESEEQYMAALDKGDWTFLQEAQALRLREPVNLKEKRILAFGKRAVPFIWSVANYQNNKVWEIAKGTVRIDLDGREAVEGKDYEVDYANGFIRCLNAEDCASGKAVDIAWGIRPDPENHPDVIVGVGTVTGKKLKNLFKEVFRGVDPEKLGSSEVWSTSVPGKFMPNRPFKGNPFMLTVTRKGKRDSRELEPGVDFWFDGTTQEITLSSPDLVDLEKEYLQAWGIAEDNRTYQFPGAIEKGSVRYTFSGRELEEGKDFIVDYDRNRVTLKNHDFMTTTKFRGGVSRSIVVHSLVAGEWEVHN